MLSAVSECEVVDGRGCCIVVVVVDVERRRCCWLSWSEKWTTASLVGVGDGVGGVWVSLPFESANLV